MKNIARAHVLLAWLVALPGAAAWGQVGLVTASQQEQLQAIQASAKAAAKLAQKPSFQDVLDEVYQGREEASDLSAAAPGHRYYFDLHVQYRDGADEEFKDHKNRRPEHMQILPGLVAVDPYWSGFIPSGDAVFTRMESLYFFDFRVVGTSLHYHQIFQEMAWPKGQTPPWGTPMDVVEHGGKTLEPGQRVVMTRMIGKREYRITFGFTVE